MLIWGRLLLTPPSYSLLCLTLIHPLTSYFHKPRLAVDFRISMSPLIQDLKTIRRFAAPVALTVVVASTVPSLAALPRTFLTD
ncbi:uncharacterized protein F5147DRAFT_417061 [Suillus discolor]|uniref:Secreted protein n=1 Tax=Suillus discolor TaxID=1912936 RepID=A0A9P7EXB3_9AGAM|nr:uncharacterized protein F5147DRAFT_417061 [Suillus discolor]KAG2094241.1 hypothetical protein F5147DRAFT_417061 [Suillus discolor]